MLNVFPDFLAFSLVAPAILRIAVGVMFLNAGVKKLRRTTWVTELFTRLNLTPASSYAIGFGILEVASGLLLIVGLFTQIAALVTALISAFALYCKRTHPEQTPGSSGAFLLLLVISLSLLFSGAGFLAFDLPL